MIGRQTGNQSRLFCAFNLYELLPERSAHGNLGNKLVEPPSGYAGPPSLFAR
jgi:hypothetical protein